MIKNRIGLLIKNVLLETGLTQKNLADKLGVKPQLICNWINGFSNPKDLSLKRIADATNKPLSYFLDDSVSGDFMVAEKTYGVCGSQSKDNHKVNVNTDLESYIERLIERLERLEKNIEENIEKNAQKLEKIVEENSEMLNLKLELILEKLKK